ncbi:MAG: heavy metal translocating P-type ATPase metal-binding domain-containing protein [Anaerolineales bacterium]
MPETEELLRCDLCGREIEGDPVKETIGGEEHVFCCDGCARVYRKAYQNGILEQVLAEPEKQKRAMHMAPFESSDSAFFNLDGMWCSGCAQAAERVLEKQPGIKSAQVSFAAERGRIDFNPEQADPEQVLKSLDGLGYKARVLTDKGAQKAERKKENMLLQLIVAFAFGMQVMLLYFELLYPRYSAGTLSGSELQKYHIFAWILATPALFVGGSSILRGAWRALRARTATMDTLVALGTLSAYGYSVYVTLRGAGEVYFDSVVMITTFIMFGRYLEMLGGTQARKDLRNLLRLRPEHAWRRVSSDWVKVDASDLEVGDTVLVKPGEHVPADGSVVIGEGAVNEAMLTGESRPVSKVPGDQLYAGTTVQENALTMEVDQVSQGTRLAKITDLVEQTLASKPPIQRLADRASAYFAAGILAASILTGIGWFFLAGQGLGRAVIAAVAVLVVACPCALGLATPLALTVSLGRATRSGILIRKPAAIEMAARVDRVVLDKTGTLTEGQMSVVDVVVTDTASMEKEQVMRLAASVEQKSTHPIAQAILAEAGRDLLEIEEFKQERGRGAQALIHNGPAEKVRIGTQEYVGLKENDSNTEHARQHQLQGETVVWISRDEKLLGFIALSDRLHRDARNLLAALSGLNVKPVMLSGDNQDTTRAVAEKLNLQDFEGNCPPEQKALKIKSWQEQGEHVAMVGDGINDAPALAAADLSITVYGGTDIAGETSDVILTREDLLLIPWLISSSRRTRRIILENLGWAFAYNLVSVPLAAFGLISPVIAAAAMATSSLLVVGNSLRLRRL